MAELAENRSAHEISAHETSAHETNVWRAAAPRRGLALVMAAVAMLLGALVTPVSADEPDAPTGVTVSEITTSSAMIEWDDPEDGSDDPEDDSIAEYVVSLDPSDADPVTVAGNQFSTGLTGLAADTEYEVTVTATNAEGSESTSETFTTLPLALTKPSAPPSQFAVNQDDGTLTARLTWFKIDETAKGTGENFRYEVNQDMDTDSWFSVGDVDSWTSPTLGTGIHTFQVRAANDEGFSEAADPESVTIVALPAAPGPPGTPTVSNAGSTLNVSWSAGSVNSPSSPITGYRVQMRQGGSVVDTKTVGGLATDFANVDPGSYIIGVTTLSGDLQSAESIQSYAFTLTPGGPQSVTAVVDDDNTVTVTWGPPQNDGGGIANYTVTLAPANDGPLTLGASARSAVFSGLPSGNYTVTVTATNEAGSSSATDTFPIRVAPGAPLNVRGTTGVATTTVTWDPPANNGNGTISEYVITVGTQTQTIAATAPRTATFANVPFGKYTARVQARNAQGLSAAGVSPEFESIRPFHPFDTREAYVRQMFSDTLNRAPSAGELIDWVGVTRADRTNAASNIVAFMRRDQFEARRQVARLYFAYFGRVPDYGGQVYWSNLMETGVLDIQDVSDEFARSREFQLTYGDVEETVFIALVYRNVLLRTADQAGFNYWLQERRNGLSRGGVMTWFTEGEEFKRLSLGAVESSLGHIVMLGRSPTQGEYGLWLSRIKADPSGGLDRLIKALYDSDEYTARVTPS